MNFYQQQVLAIEKDVFPHRDVAEKVMTAKRYIDRHYASEISLDVLAREACLSKFHFIRSFSRHYGRTPNNYLREVRLVRAKVLLRSGMSVRDVCAAVGFDSVPTFVRVYKTYMGITPGKAILNKKV